MPTPIPEHVRDLARMAADAGGRAFLVGGWVRDQLLGRASKDFDVEVFGVPADRLRALLDERGPVHTVGESFAVYKLGDVDVSLPRRESKVGPGHRGFRVEGDPGLSFAEAARRRDFTINAISMDPLTGEIVDPFDGRQDLDRRRLRMVDATTFADDSLRVLRAIQLAARFDLAIDDETAALCRSMPLEDLPAERIWGELEKLLLKADRPSIGLALALDLGTVASLWPEVEALVGCPQEPEWHPEGDVWIHTLMVTDQARQRLDGLDHGPAVAMMLGAVCHDLGKPATTTVIDGRIRSPNHEALGIEPATAFLDRLNVHTMGGYDVRHAVLGLVAHHLRPSAFRKAPTPVSDGAFRRLAQKVDLELLARFARADCFGRGGHFDCSAMDWFIERARQLGVERQPPAPLLMGRHLLALGMPPGPNMGAVLEAVYEKQLDGEIATLDDAQAEARRLMEETPGP